LSRELNLTDYYELKMCRALLLRSVAPRKWIHLILPRWMYMLSSTSWVLSSVSSS